jgi:hypothetical protein
MVVLPGTALVERMRQYFAFSRREVLAQLPEQKSASLANGRPVEIDLPPDLVKSGTVAVIYDESEGLAFFAGFGEFERAFAEPALLDQRLYRQRRSGNPLWPGLAPHFARPHGPVPESWRGEMRVTNPSGQSSPGGGNWPPVMRRSSATAPPSSTRATPWITR